MEVQGVTEEWVDIDWHSDIYQVSNMGRVRSRTHYCEGRNGSGRQNGRVLKPSKSKKGYLRVSLSINKNRKKYAVHRLVAIAFLDNPDNKEQVNHKNGIKDDNRLCNLEWCTNSENIRHAFKTGLIKPNKADKHHNSKLSNKDVLIARKERKKGCTVSYLADKYGVSRTAMSKILRNLTYINI